MTKDREAAAQALRAQQDLLATCTDCSLCQGRTQVVFGAGSPVADLLFVGEGPGFNEDKVGEPFVGQAGKLLTELLAGIGLAREDVYIANVVKCRPPGNRDPLPAEIEACSPKLMEQVRILQPRVVCTLGRFATRLIAQTEAPITSIRGRAKAGEVAGVPVLIFPVFHPAAALYTPANKAVLEDDFQKLRVLLARGQEALAQAAGRRVAEQANGPNPPAPADPPRAAVQETRLSGRRENGEQLELW